MGGRLRTRGDVDERGRDERLARAALERFRQTGLRLDREGRFWHESGEVVHAGMRRAFLRWIDRLEDGRSILRLDAERYVYLDVDDAPLLVASARWVEDRILVTTNDGVEAELDYASLTVGAEHALYCRVRGGRLEARITTPAYYVLADAVEEIEGGGRYALRAAGQQFPIGARSSPTCAAETSASGLGKTFAE
jgi:hypothetical protein